MSRVNLRVATDILKRFGEELNQSADQGILELVKNAYDADATECTIELSGTDSPGGTVRISDTGDGMDEDDIVNGWLVLGRSSKSTDQPTRRGRIPAGNKGLGRLAALRMGARTSLVTRPKWNSGCEYQLEIDWSKYDEANVVEEVNLDLRSVKRASGARHGTAVTISGVREQLKRTDVRRLARGLLLLADPFGDNPEGFQPILKAPEFEDLERLVRGRYFNDAEFHLTANVDEGGVARSVVTDFKGDVLFTTDHNDLSRKGPNPLYRCPAAQFDLWVYIFDAKTFMTRTTSMNEVKAWASEFGGVHLYVNGLRVAPYGDSGNDWLEMNLSRTRHPELRPSTNTSIGRITVRDLDNKLPQKTDRSGLVEGEALSEIRRFAKDALEWLSRERLRARDAARGTQRVEAPRRVERAKQSFEATLRTLPDKAQQAIRAPYEQLESAREREVLSLRKEVQLYRTLSTAGITASVFAHESRNPIRLIIQNVKQAIRRAQQHLGANYANTLEEPLERIRRQGETLQAFGNLTLHFIERDKRRAARVDVHTVVNNVLDVFNSLLKEREVKVTTELTSGSPYLRASEAAVESVITNLIVNSLRAFERVPPKDRRLVIRTELTSNSITIRVLDNGPGIQGISLKDIWLPGETTYPSGTGLGLTIVRDTIRDIGGDVDALLEGELGGAEFVVRLPIIGA